MKATRSLLLALALSLLLVSIAQAGDPDWPGASSRVNLSQSSSVRESALTAGDGMVVATWANWDTRNIHWATHSGDGWSSIQTLPTTEDAWAPHVVLSSTQPFVTWSEGTYPYPASLFERELGSGSTRSIMIDVYGRLAPQLAAGDEGLHFVVAAAQTSNDWSKADLYYAHRPFTSATWPAPAIAITRTQAVPGAVGGIWQPRVAWQADTQTLHVVWEQTVAASGGNLHTTWYVSGAWSPSHVTWSTPYRLSPEGQMAVRPDVGVDANGNVHVVWAELIGDDIARPDAQYVNYRRLEGSQWTHAVRLDPQPVLINTINPTWIRTSMDVKGNSLCVTWHGYRNDASEEKEEILLRCSVDGGQTWLMVLNGSRTPQSLSLYPVIAIDDEEGAHLVWEEYQGGGDFFHDYDLLYTTGPSELYPIFLPIILRRS